MKKNDPSNTISVSCGLNFGLTQRIMRLLLSLVPWMAVGTAAAFQSGGPRPAEAVLEFADGKRLAASRVGDECYITASALESAGVQCTFDALQAKVTAYGRTAQVTYRLQSKQKVVPLGEVARQLGGRGLWSNDGAFHILASAKRITFIDGVLSVFAGLPYESRIRVVQDPPRLVVRLEGCELDAKVSKASDMPWKLTSSGASSFEVSIPIQAGFAASQIELPKRPTLVLKLAEALVQAPKTSAPQKTGIGTPAGPPKPRDLPPDHTSTKGSSGENRETAQTVTEYAKTELAPLSENWDLQPTRWNAPPVVRIGGIELASRSSKGAVLVLKGDRDFAVAPSIRRITEQELEIVIPNATMPGAVLNPIPELVQTLESRVTEEGLVLKLVLQSALGVQFGVRPGEIHLALVVRQPGNGGLSGKTIVLDAGHGGHDTGARSPDKKVVEKDLALSVTKKVSDLLVQEGVLVIMTRKTDDFETLRERPEIANRNGAAAFVSVHINSSPRPNSRSGGITFYHGKDPVGILLAECIQSEVARVSGIPNLGAWSDLRLYETGLAVLRYARVPAVLIELGFINHSRDRARLMTQDFQNAAAGAIVRGLKVFLGHGQE